MAFQRLVKQFRKRFIIGSAGFYLKESVGQHNAFEYLVLDSKCNFQRVDNGLIFRSSNSNRLTEVFVPDEDVIKIELKQEVKPHTFWRFSSYRQPMYLLFETKEFTFKLVGSGYSFKSQQHFFESCSCANRFSVVRY